MSPRTLGAFQSKQLLIKSDSGLGISVCRVYVAVFRREE